MPPDLLHIDTDFGTNPDDACAIAMVAGWHGARMVGLTTVDDADRGRARRLRALLADLGCDVPVTAGSADVVTALAAAADRGATVVAIGPCSNLAALERVRPDALAGLRVVLMGGWVDGFGAGFPTWGPERDHNVQADREAVLTVFESRADLTFVPCSAAAAATLRTPDLVQLRATGPVGRQLAEQSQEHAERRGYPRLAAHHAALPDDLVTFHWDPVTCAVALGWAGARVEEMRLRPAHDGAALRFERHPEGRRTSVVTDVDGATFSRTWLDAVAAAQRPHRR